MRDAAQPPYHMDGSTVAGTSTQSGAQAIVDIGTVVGPAQASVSVATSTGLWATWASIAVSNEDRAHRARAELVREFPAGGNWGEASTTELESSLVAISAAAFAIDGFYGSVKPWAGASAQLIQQWQNQRLGRNRQIFEVFKLAFVLGAATNRWAKEFHWLFKLRDDNIHFDEDFRPPVPHPVIGNTSHERMTYTVENAEKAVDVMLDALGRLVAHPKPTAHAQLIDFAHRWRANVNALLARREALARDRAS